MSPVDRSNAARPSPSRRRRPLAAIGAGLALLAGLAACSGGVSRADAYEALGDTLMQRAAYPAAVDAYDRSTKLDSNEARRWLKLGRVWRALNNPALSATAYRRALDLDPANVEALENLAVLLVRAGQYDDAKEYVTPLLTLAPNDPGGLLGAGAIAFYERRYEDATKIADQIIQIVPDRADGYVLRARVLEALGNTGKAAALLEQRLAIDPGDEGLATQLMELYRRHGDLQGIRRTSLVLAKLRPADVPIQLEAARALHAAGREDQARQIHAGLLARYPASPSLNGAIAQYWITTLPRDQAIAKIVEMAGRVHGKARIALADLIVALGQPAVAVRVLAADAAGPVDRNSVDTHAAYAHALLLAGRDKEAAAAADAVSGYDSNDTATLVHAQIALRQGKFDQALGMAQQVRDGDKDNVEAALMIPKAYEGKGNLVLARQAFGDAMVAIPNSLEVMKAYAEWLAAHGAPDDAISLANQFRRGHDRLGPASDYVAELCRRYQTETCRAAAVRKHPWDL